MAEEYGSRLRRAKIDIPHTIAGAYLLRDAQEPSGREDSRCLSRGDQVNSKNNREALGGLARRVRAKRGPMTGSGVTRRIAIGAPMDRTTKATLWVAFTILATYFVWFFVDCAMDDACHIVCVNGGRGGCHTQRLPDAKLP